MKFLCILLLIVAARANLIRSNIPAPKLTSLVTTDKFAAKITWTPVKGGTFLNAISGYKVKVWEQQQSKVIEYEMVDGEMVLVEKDVLLPFTGQIPDWKPKELKVAGAKATSAEFYEVKPGVAYEFRVQAYTSKEDGPLSDGMRIQFEAREEE